MSAAEGEKPQEHKVEVKAEKASDSLAQSMPVVDGNNLRAALMANPRRHWTIPPEGKDEGKPRESFQLVDNGKVIASKDNSEAVTFGLKNPEKASRQGQDQAYKEAGFGDSDKPVGRAIDSQAKEVSVRATEPEASAKPDVSGLFKSGSLYSDGVPAIPRQEKNEEKPDIVAQAEFWRIQPTAKEKAQFGNIAVGELQAAVNVAVQTITSAGDLARMSFAAGPAGRLAPDLDPGGKKMLDDACGGMSNFTRVMLQLNTTMNPTCVLYRQDFDPEGRQMAERVLAKLPEQLKKELQQYKNDDVETKARKLTELSLNIALLTSGAGELSKLGSGAKTAEGMGALSKTGQEAKELSLAGKFQDDLKTLQEKLKSIHSEKLQELRQFLQESFNAGGPRYAHDGPPMNLNANSTDKAKDYISPMVKPKDSDGFSKSDRSKPSESDERIEDLRKGINIERLAEHPAIRDVLKKAAAENVIEPSDGKKVSDIIAKSLRDEFPDIDKRNIAFGIYTESNGEQRLIIATSKEVNAPGLAPLVKEPTFKIVPAGGQDVRLDSEYKIMELLNKELPKTAEGKLALYTEQVPCRSCGPVIDQFLERYPKLKEAFKGASFSYKNSRERLNANAMRSM